MHETRLHNARIFQASNCYDASIRAMGILFLVTWKKMQVGCSRKIEASKTLPALSGNPRFFIEY